MPSHSPTPNHACPFADKVSIEGGDHIEGRFSALETQVVSLTHGLETMERTVTEGFRAVFVKIDNIGATRASHTIPWIMVGFAVLGLIATVGFQAINGVALAVAKSENNLAVANSRELQYREDKGRSEERAIQISKSIDTFTDTYQRQHKELDEKLEREITMTGLTIDSRIIALDGKLLAEMAGWRSKIDDQIEQLREKQKRRGDSDMKRLAPK